MSPYFLSLLRRTMRKPIFWFSLFVVGAVVTMLVSASLNTQRYEQSIERASASLDSGDLIAASEYLREADEFGEGDELDGLNARWALLRDSERNFTKGYEALEGGNFAEAYEYFASVDKADPFHYEDSLALIELAAKGLNSKALEDASLLSAEGKLSDAVALLSEIPSEIRSKSVDQEELRLRVQHVALLFETGEIEEVLEESSRAVDRGYEGSAFEPYYSEASNSYAAQIIKGTSLLGETSEIASIYSARSRINEARDLTGPNALLDEELGRINAIIDSRRSEPNEDESKSKQNSEASISSLDAACSAMKSADLAVARAGQNLYSGDLSQSDISSLKASERRISQANDNIDGDFYWYMVGQANSIYLLWTSLEAGDGGSAFFAIDSYLDGDQYSRFCR